MSRKDGYDAIVIGAGIIGLSCAYYLTKAGKCVLVLERGQVGSGTSGACDEMILLQSKAPGLSLEMAFVSLDIYRSLQAELGEDLEFETRGGMIIIEKAEHLPIMKGFVAKQRSFGLNVEILSKKEAKIKQPFVSDSVVASTYSPDDSQVNPLRVMFALLRAGTRAGMALKRGSEVTSVTRTVWDSWEVATAGGHVYSSDVVVNTAGVWAPRIASLVNLLLPIEPKRGQIVVTEPIHPFGETNAWDSEYIVSKLMPDLPRDERAERLGLGFAMSRTRNGNYLIGSTREYVGFDRDTTHEAIEAISAKAVSLFPALANVRIIRSFSGLRPACGDGKCILGEDPQNPGFFVAAGHEGDGIALAPVTGKFLADLVCGRKTELDVAELSPARFRKAEVMTKHLN
ncbi:MAG TPA: FAD-dependent oxidoreductase [Thermosynergistes sp.]|nr:FAD-dependent oxidoreductase [Thermosynergistes sp.]